MLRIPHCLDNQLIDGGKVVSPTHPPHFTSQEHYYFNASGTHFCLEVKVAAMVVVVFVVVAVVVVVVIVAALDTMALQHPQFFPCLGRLIPFILVVV
jgi:hypothetical protein